jgi:hypothetical protein
MSELVTAFDVVMGSDLSTRASARSWGKLALHCEIYSVTQLRRIYDVHTLELLYDPEFISAEPEPEPEPEPETELEPALEPERYGALVEAAPRVWPAASHPFDSGADLKRHLEEVYGDEWCLFDAERGLDRYDCRQGWELLPQELRENPSESVRRPPDRDRPSAVTVALRIHAA